MARAYADRITRKVTPTISTAIYAAGDSVGGELAFLIDANQGKIDSLAIYDNDGEAAVLTLYLFDSQPATIADQAAFSVADADRAKLIGIVASGTYNTTAGADIQHGLNIPFNLGSGNTIYGYLVATATPTYTAVDDLTIGLQISLD